MRNFHVQRLGRGGGTGQVERDGMAQEIGEICVWGDTGQLEECLRKKQRWTEMLLRGWQVEYEEMATLFGQVTLSLSPSRL